MVPVPSDDSIVSLALHALSDHVVNAHADARVKMHMQVHKSDLTKSKEAKNAEHVA